MNKVLYDSDIKKKTLKSRFLSVFSALILMFTFFNDMGLMSAVAENFVSDTEEIFLPETADELIPEETEIIYGDLISEELSNSDLTSAAYSELSDEETMEILRFSQNVTAIMAQDAGDSNFIEYDYTEDVAKKGLEVFWLKYVGVSQDDISDTQKEIEDTSVTLQSISVDSNFSVKCKLQIKCDLSVEPGRMKVKVPGQLFQNRDGELCKIYSVGVSQFNNNQEPVPVSEGKYVFDETNGKNDKVPFRYYIDENGDYYFVNTKKLNSSTTEIEISYNPVEIFDVANSTGWEIIPEIDVWYDLPKSYSVSGDIKPHYVACVDATGTTYYKHDIESYNNQKYYVYYDENKKPIYVEQKKSETESDWYQVNDSVAAEITSAEILMNTENPQATKMTENIPEITEITVPYEHPQKYGQYGIAGIINTEVVLDPVQKIPAEASGRGYGPQLYTTGQMSKYIDLKYAKLIAPDLFIGENQNKLSDDYVYFCWDVTTTGTCTQPFSMLFDEKPRYINDSDPDNPVEVSLDDDDAIVLGVTTRQVSNNSKHSDIKYSESKNGDIIQLTQYVTKENEEGNPENQLTVLKDKNGADVDEDNLWYVADTNSEMRGKFGYDKVVENKTFANKYYVVVAYRKSAIERSSPKILDDGTEQPYYDVSNTVTAYLFSRDGVQEQNDTAASAAVTIEEYEWTGGYNGFDSHKYAESKDRDGWLTAYDKLSENSSNKFLGDFIFKSDFHARTYFETHSHQAEDLYSHSYSKNGTSKNGVYVKVVAVDDVMTAQPYGDIVEGNNVKRLYGSPYLLDGTDYEYYKAEIEISDYDIDTDEDETISAKRENFDDPETIIKNGDSSLKRGWTIYGMYGNSTSWKPIDLRPYIDGLSADAEYGKIYINEYLDKMNNKGKLKLELNFSDRKKDCPYRIKIEHDTIGYSSDTVLRVYARVLTSSIKFALGGSLRNGQFYDKDGTAYTILNGTVDGNSAGFNTFRINIRNYTAFTATTINTNDNTKKPLIDMLARDTNGNHLISNNGYYYPNYEANPYSTHINANRYDFVGNEYLFDYGTGSKGHTQFIGDTANPSLLANGSDRTKSIVGTNILIAENLGGNTEYVPYPLDPTDSLADVYSSSDSNLKNNYRISRDSADVEVSTLEENSSAEKFASWENDTSNGQVIMTYTLYGYEGYKLTTDIQPIIVSENLADEPMRQDIYIYDILPPGVNYYGSFQPVCGKLSTTKVKPDNRSLTPDDVETFYGTWQTTNDDISITEINIQQNWNHSGRTLVRFKIHYNNDKGILTDDLWYIGCGIRFKAHVSWDTYQTASEKDNIFAYVAADNHHNGDIYGQFTGVRATSQTFDDNSVLMPYTNSNTPNIDYSPFDGTQNLDELTAGDLKAGTWGTDEDYEKNLDGTPKLDESGNRKYITQHNRMYGHANSMESITTARTIGITKEVKADDEVNADFKDQTSVIGNHGYTYKIHIDQTEKGSVYNLIVFDKLENFDASKYWQGTFNGVDLTEFTKSFPMAEPKIYYAESRDAPTVLYVKNPEETNEVSVEFTFDYNDVEVDTEHNRTIDEYRAKWKWDKIQELQGSAYVATKWYSEEDWLKPASEGGLGKTLAEVGSVAVDLSKVKSSYTTEYPNGFYLKDITVLNIYLKMTAPAYANNDPKKYTLNTSSFHFTPYFGDTGIDGKLIGTYSTSNITTVTLGQNRTVQVVKKAPSLAEQNDEKLKHAKFTFKITHRLGYYPDIDSSQQNALTDGNVPTDDLGNDLQAKETGDSNHPDPSFANIGYTVWTYTIDSNGKPVKGTQIGTIHTTNDYGEFTLEYGQMAVFEDVAAVSITDSVKNKYDFDNFTIVEKSVPYMFGKKTIKTTAMEQATDGSVTTITLTNFYRPVIYISKTTTGVPDGVTGLETKFQYHVKVKKINYHSDGTVNAEEPYTYLKADDFKESGGYWILNKTLNLDSQQSDYTTAQANEIDKRDDGKLYWYPVNNTAGLFEMPDGWEYYAMGNTIENDAGYYPHNNEDSISDTDGNLCFTVTLDTNKTNVLALPIYIQHIKSGTDEGMLVPVTKDDNTIYLPRYEFEIQEINDAVSDWRVQTPEGNPLMTTNLEEEENSVAYVNIYKYKDILLKKTVTHAPDNLNNYVFAFRLTQKQINENGVETQEAYHEFGNADDGGTKPKVTWKLFKQNSDGELTEYKDGNNNAVQGEIAENGFFTVPMCGNSDKAVTDPIVIRISGLTMEENYTVTEFLNIVEENEKYYCVDTDSDGLETRYEITIPEGYTIENMATTKEFIAEKSSDSADIAINSLVTKLDIKNDYIKRDLTIKKTVVASPIPKDNQFEIVLVPEQNAVTNLTELNKIVSSTIKVSGIIDNFNETGKTGYQFKLKDSESITFHEIGSFGDKFTVYEKIDATYKPINLGEVNDGDIYSQGTLITLSQASDMNFTVLNGDDGFVVIQKEYQYPDGMSEEDIASLNFEDKEITFSIKSNHPAGTITGNIVKLDKDGNSENISSLANIKMKATDMIIVNMNGIFGEMVDYTVEETAWSEPLVLNGVPYSAEPVLWDSTKTNGEWNFTSKDVQAVITNQVFKHDSILYKRIGFALDSETTKPEGNLVLTLTKNGVPVSNVRCVPAYVDAQGVTQYSDTTFCSDENGNIAIDYSAIGGDWDSWKNSNISDYYLKMYFDQNVKFYPTDSNIAVCENTFLTDSSWGVPVGYETYGDSTTYITETILKTGTQWHQNSDTVVNTQEKEPFEVTKTVSPSGIEENEDGTQNSVFTESDLSAEFEFIIAEKIEGNYEPSPNIAYTVWELTNRTQEESAENPYIQRDTTVYYTNENGIFKLKHGQKAILQIAKDAYWQVTENNSGIYKLVTDEDGKITHGGTNPKVGELDAATHYQEGEPFYKYTDYVLSSGRKVDVYIAPDSSQASGYTCYYVTKEGQRFYLNENRGSQSENYTEEMTIKDKFLLDYVNDKNPALSDSNLKSLDSDIDEVTYGFEVNSTLDMSVQPEEPYGVVLVNALGKGTKERKLYSQPMFAKYDESHDSLNEADDGTDVPRTHKEKSAGQDNYYYQSGLNQAYQQRYYNSDTFGGNNTNGLNHRKEKSYLLGNKDSIYPELSGIEKIYNSDDFIDSNLVWSYENGTAAYYREKNVIYPESVFWENPVTHQKEKHPVVGIGRSAFVGAGERTSITIPKYVEKIGDNAFNNCNTLTTIIWDGDNYPDDAECGVKVIGAWAFNATKVDVTLPKTIQTIEQNAFDNYNGTQNARNSTSKSIIVPESLRYLAGTGAHFGAANNYTGAVTLRIGDGDSIPNMKTSFKTITDGNGKAIDTFGLDEVLYTPYTVIFGQNPDGLTISSSCVNLFDRTQNRNPNMYYGRTIVFPKGKLTLQQNCLKQGGDGDASFLRVFLTDNPTDLTIEGTMTQYKDKNGNYHVQYIVFPNLTRTEAEASEGWATKINNLVINSSVARVNIYYKNDLTADVVNNIINAVGTDYIDDEVKTLLQAVIPHQSSPHPPVPVLSSSKLIYTEKKKSRITQ